MFQILFFCYCEAFMLGCLLSQAEFVSYTPRIIQLLLFQVIRPESSGVKMLGTKVEVNLKKAEPFHWPSLEMQPEKPASSEPDTNDADSQWCVGIRTACVQSCLCDTLVPGMRVLGTWTCASFWRKTWSLTAPSCVPVPGGVSLGPKQGGWWKICGSDRLPRCYVSAFVWHTVGVCTLLVWMSFGSFGLWELTCMHCVYLALWTHKVLCGSCLCSIYAFSFIHSNHWSISCQAECSILLAQGSTTHHAQGLSLGHWLSWDQYYKDYHQWVFCFDVRITEIPLVSLLSWDQYYRDYHWWVCLTSENSTI